MGFLSSFQLFPLSLPLTNGTKNTSQCDRSNEQVTAALDVTDVTATSTRNSTTGVVSLTVTWTPGNYTGPTRYLVTLDEEGRLGSSSYTIVDVQIVTGYNTSEWTKTDVLAYWNYRVFVQAMTDAGNSSVNGPNEVRTATNTPSVPQYVTVRQDGAGAELALTITCPEEKERNGTITGYVIRKVLLDATSGVIPESEHTVHADSSQTCINTYTARDIGGVTVEQNYTFAVKVRNADFEGNYSQQTYLYVEPRGNSSTCASASTIPVAWLVAVPVVFIIILIIIVCIIVVKWRKSKQNKSANRRPYNTTNTALNDVHSYYGITGRAYVMPLNTNPGGQEDISMVGLHTHQTSLQRRNGTDYLEPIDYYDTIGNIHSRPASQSSAAVDQANPLPNSDTRAESDE